MLCFRLKCIAKFVVFPDLELTVVKQILQVAMFLSASLKPKCLKTGDRKDDSGSLSFTSSVIFNLQTRS